jgi:hypothetical protein
MKSTPENSTASVIVFDELGRLVNPCEAFYMQNPPPPGQPCSPIAEVDAYDIFGSTPLANAVSGRDQAEVIRLLKNKANPNLFNAYGYTALEAAAHNNDLVMARLLLKGGARADVGHPLAYTNNPEVTALLRQHGAVETSPKPQREIYIKGVYMDSYAIGECCMDFYKRLYERN